MKLFVLPNFNRQKLSEQNLAIRSTCYLICQMLSEQNREEQIIASSNSQILSG